MSKARIEAFTDGVLAIVITIMVLEMKAPHGAGRLSDLGPLLPVFLSYVLSFLYVGIYWNNHHHLLHTAEHASAGMMWANLHLLFWLSLFPVVTHWMGAHPSAPAPSAVYGAVLFMAAIAYRILQRAIVRSHGDRSVLAKAIGRDVKGRVSPILYAVAVPLAFVRPWASQALYALVALMWLIPDRRIERAVAGSETAD